MPSLDDLKKRIKSVKSTQKITKAKKMDDLEVIKAAFEESGFDSERLISQMQNPDVKAKLISNTEAAVERGVFGIPTFFVGDEMYFGKDTLWQVEEALLK